MEDKIEVGEYVKTEFGNIGKFYRPASENSDVYYIYIDKGGNKYTSRYDSIVKHSKNIIELIEVGDYVNGKKIISVYLDGATHYIKYEFYDGTRIYNEDIKSIVTKEQYKQIEYIVEE